jgi:hypothetical protein
MAGIEQGRAPFPVSSGGVGGDGSGGMVEGPAQPVFQAYRYEEPPGKPSRIVWVVLGLGVLLLAGGVAYKVWGPREAAAQPKALNFKEMTADQLAQDASALAAHELARRMSSGTAAERTAALQTVQDHPSQRLAQNMAMALATEAQKKQTQVMADVQRNVRMAEEGYEPATPGRR